MKNLCESLFTSSCNRFKLIFALSQAVVIDFWLKGYLILLTIIIANQKLVCNYLTHHVWGPCRFQLVRIYINAITFSERNANKIFNNAFRIALRKSLKILLFNFVFELIDLWENVVTSFIKQKKNLYLAKAFY